MCILGSTEREARDVLEAAHNAGFNRAQIQFSWDHVTPEFLRQLPRWLASAGIVADVLSAYVNCAVPQNIVMSTRAEDFDRAIDMAPEVGARTLVAWTGGYGQGLMTADQRNFTAAASDSIRRFLEPRLRRLESGSLRLALESYITLACPDAPSLRRLLDRLPRSVTAVYDPPNLTPLARFEKRDAVLREMARTLEGRIGVVHCKDFRMGADRRSYDLPGPLQGQMNYKLFIEQIRRMPGDVPVIAEHIGPAGFARVHRELGGLMRAAEAGPG